MYAHVVLQTRAYEYMYAYLFMSIHMSNVCEPICV